MRLGLVSLSYLWQQPQLPFFDDTIGCGVEAVLVIVAGVGLGVDLLGMNLREVRALLARLVGAYLLSTVRTAGDELLDVQETKYGSHPAGEGGEYETITKSTPIFSHRLRFIKSEIVMTDPEPFPVAYLRVDEAKLEEKAYWVQPGMLELRQMLHLDHTIDGLDELGRQHLGAVGQ